MPNLTFDRTRRALRAGGRSALSLGEDGLQCSAIATR
jgi:hypothetical protein